MARKLAVVIYNMLAKKKEFVEEHAFKTLKEKKLKNMEVRSGRYHEFKKEDMEKVIREVGIHEKSRKPIS